MAVTKIINRRWEHVKKDTIELSALTRYYELYNRTEGKSPKTIRWYNLSLRQFHRFLLDVKKPTVLGELGETEAREACHGKSSSVAPIGASGIIF